MDTDDSRRATDPVERLGIEFDGDLPASVDGAAVRRMATAARVLDAGVRVPGTRVRVGIDPILGVVPGAGDALAAGLSLYIVLEAARLGVSAGTVVRMLATVAADALLGSIPVVGVLIDALFRANVRNLRLALSDLAVADGSEGTDAVEIEVTG